MYCIYMLKCKDNTIYTGITNNLSKRIKAHECGEGAKYTRGRGPFEVLGIWEVEGKSSASKVEYFIKKSSKIKKLKFISVNGHLEDLVLEEKEIKIKRVELENLNF